MPRFLFRLLPLTLTALATLLFLLSQGTALPPWQTLCAQIFGFITVIGLLTGAAWYAWPDSPGIPLPLARKITVTVWLLCAVAVPIGWRLAQTPLEQAAFAEPMDLQPKLEDWKAHHGTYPPTLTRIAPWSLGRLLLQYQTSGHNYELTLLTTQPEKCLWVYDGVSGAWSREK